MNHEIIGKRVYVKTRYTVIAGEVVKITPSGKVDVKYPSGTVVRFNPDGEATPADRWNRVALLSDEDAVKELAYEEKKNKLIKVSNAIREVAPTPGVNHMWGAGSLQKEIDRLQGLLDVAKAAIAEVK